MADNEAANAPAQVSPLRAALRELADESQTGSHAGMVAWAAYWSKRERTPITPWQAYQLGLRTAAGYRPDLDDA